MSYEDYKKQYVEYESGLFIKPDYLRSLNSQFFPKSIIKHSCITEDVLKLKFEEHSTPVKQVRYDFVMSDLGWVQDKLIDTLWHFPKQGHNYNLEEDGPYITIRDGDYILFNYHCESKTILELIMRILNIISYG